VGLTSYLTSYFKITNTMNFLWNQTAHLRDRVAESSPSNTQKGEDQDSGPPVAEEIVDASDRTAEDNVASLIMASVLSLGGEASAVSDPEVIHLQHEIRLSRAELRRMKQSGNNTRRRRANQELKVLEQKKNSVARALRMKQQTQTPTHNFMRMGALNEYKAELLKSSLPDHDTSPATLNMEAKLLRAYHNDWTTDRQMVIVQKLQQGMIDYMYSVALPEIREERELAVMVGEHQVEKARKSKDNQSDAYEHCLGLQRKIIAKYRLRELEQQNKEQHRDQDGGVLVVDESEMEALKVAAGETPTMERVPELRDSAKARMEARSVEQGRMEDRKKKIEEIKKNVDGIVQQEKEALDRVNKHALTLSGPSVDLLNEDLDDLSSLSGDEFGDSGKNRDDSPKKGGKPALAAAAANDNDHNTTIDNEEDLKDENPTTPSLDGSLRANKDDIKEATGDGHGAESDLSDSMRRSLRSPEVARPKLRGTKAGIAGDSSAAKANEEEAIKSEQKIEPKDESESSANDDYEGSESNSGADEGGVPRRRIGVSSRVGSRTSTSRARAGGRGAGPAGGRGLGSRKTPARGTSSGGRGARSGLLERARVARLSTASEHGTGTGGRGGGSSSRPNIGSGAAASRDFGSKGSSSHRHVSSISNPEERQARLERLRNRASGTSDSGAAATAGVGGVVRT
jgi:hypothetical protein